MNSPILEVTLELSENAISERTNDEMKMNYENDIKECIQCGSCTAHCDFLQKYGLYYSPENLAQLKKLAFHCFLCGECTRHCPKGIDGKKIMQEIRIEQADQNKGQPAVRGFEGMLAEKADYLYKNYRHAGKGSALFMGCNFPAYFPHTARKISALYKEVYDIGTIYECCGKPVMELGVKKAADHSVESIRKRLQERGVTELIMVCPNCYSYLKDRLDIRIVTIYEKIKELGAGKMLEAKGVRIFQPCPDRTGGEWLTQLQGFFRHQPKLIEDVQCCGLGGCAKAAEPDIAAGFAKKIQKQNEGPLYTYCASCAGNLSKNNCGHIRHVLPEILGFQEEEADIWNNGKNRKESKNW